jgi:hypothetical protein
VPPPPLCVRVTTACGPPSLCYVGLTGAMPAAAARPYHRAGRRRGPRASAKCSTSSMATQAWGSTTLLGAWGSITGVHTAPSPMTGLLVRWRAGGA